MQRIVIFLCSLLGCILIMNPLIASQNGRDVENDLCILDLLPNLLCPLAVDPAIPTDFVALSPEGTLDPYDWIYWGPKSVLEAYFKNPDSLKAPILRVKLSTVVQKDANSFDCEEHFKAFGKENSKGFSLTKTRWGDYPVMVIQSQHEGKLVFVAFVGLNDPEAGWSLIFNLVYPDQKGHPSDEDRQLWENLILKTTQLRDRDYFKACGQDLQEGYTRVSVGGAKLKMLAEKRRRDGMLQVVVIPESSDTDFHYFDMMECAMGARWKYGEPMVKVYGQIVVGDDNFKSIIDHVTSIFFKTVQDFSYKKDNGKEILIFQKKGDKAG